MMGIGLGTNLLGNIFGLFGGAKSEGAGGASDNTDNTDNTDNNAKLKDDIKALQKQFPDAKLSTLSDGTILCNGTKYNSLDDVIDALKPKTPEKKDKTSDNSLKSQPDSNNTAKNTGDGKMTEGNLTNPEVVKDTPDATPASPAKQTAATVQTKHAASTKPNKSSSGSPAGWYKATSDYKANVKGITIENLKNAQKSGKSAATYVLDQVLATKGGLTQALSNNSKAQLLGEIIRKNPSVFNSDGSLKDGADISKLDVPTAKWVENTYGVNRTQSGQSFKKQEKADNYYVVRGNNGYHAKYDKKNKTWTYHNPQGQEIPEKDFQKVCKNIHASIKRQEQVNKWNSAHPDKKVTINKDGTLSTIVKKDTGTSYGVVSKKITANSFEELQKEVEKYLNKGKNVSSTKGGYAAVGGAMNRK